MISRKQPDGLLIIGSYLVDTLCLGLKDTFCKVNYTVEKYETHKTKMYRDEEPFNCDISFAHTIIYWGIDFAATFGIKPQKDFKLSKYILIEPNKIEIDKCSKEHGVMNKEIFSEGFTPKSDHFDTLHKHLGSFVRGYVKDKSLHDVAADIHENVEVLV